MPCGQYFLRCQGDFLLFFTLLAYALPTLHAQAPPAAPVVTSEVVLKRIAASQTFVGVAIPSRRSVIGSAVDGRVAVMHVNDGDPVGMVEEGEGDEKSTKGQPIVQLLTDTMSLEVAEFAAMRDLRKHELAELEKGSRPEEVARAKARLEAARALSQFASARFARNKTLFEQGATTSRETYEDSLAAATAAEQTKIAAQADYDLALLGPREEEIAQARAQLASATAMVQKLESQLSKYTLRAPFEGYVVSKMTEVGAWVSQGDPVAEIVAVDPLEIDVAVPERYIRFVQQGDSVRVDFEAFPGEVFTGTVVRIVPQADLRARTFPVKVSLANPEQPGGGRLLKAGMLAHVMLAVGPLHDALLVPKDAINLGGKTPSLMIVTEDAATKQQVARPVPVQLGVAQGSLIEVLGNLSAGQQVIVIGNERVRPGQPVSATIAKAATDGGQQE